MIRSVLCVFVGLFVGMLIVGLRSTPSQPKIIRYYYPAVGACAESIAVRAHP